MKEALSLGVFGLGFLAFIAGLVTILTREYLGIMKTLSTHSVKLTAKAIAGESISGTLDSASRLISAVTTLVRTGIGVGVFLCLLGMATWLIGFWMFTYK